MKKFKRIYIEITNICNLQCSFCPEVGRPKHNADPQSFEEISLQALPLTEQVCLHLMGEPLAHPEIATILGLASTHHAKIQLTTNGILLKKHQQLLIESNSIVQINFSLQSFKDNYPQKSYRDYLLNILDFSKELHKHRPEVYVNLRLWNKGSMDEDNEETFSLLETFYDVKINRHVDVGNIKSKNIWNRVYLHFDSRFEWPSMHVPHLGTKGRCHGLGNHIGIHTDGTVVPCCLDKEADINLGNCLKQPLLEILSSPKALKIKKGFEQGVLVEELCQRCDYIKRFN